MLVAWVLWVAWAPEFGRFFLLGEL